MISNAYKENIIKSLIPLNLNKIILFGSHAYGNASTDSDIDIYVVTNDDYIPKNFKENMELKLKVSHALKEIRKEIDIDIIVHTKAMEEKFLKINSLFTKKIFNEGIVIYENIN